MHTLESTHRPMLLSLMVHQRAEEMKNGTTYRSQWHVITAHCPETSRLRTTMTSGTEGFLECKAFLNVNLEATARKACHWVLRGLGTSGDSKRGGRLKTFCHRKQRSSTVPHSVQDGYGLPPGCLKQADSCYARIVNRRDAWVQGWSGPERLGFP